MNPLIIDHLAVVIIFEHSYFIYDKRRHLRDRRESGPSFYAALEQYTASPHAVAVREGVSAAVQAYAEAMKTAPAWMAKLRFKRSQEKQAKAQLIKTILEITLNHRLYSGYGTVRNGCMIMQYGVYVFGECRSPSAETVARATALDVPLKYPWFDFKRIKVGHTELNAPDNVNDSSRWLMDKISEKTWL
ncbi:hypothetical protein EV702DRAFT_1043350 [Suillus placidus]|uniref:Uncharacterized protein n=1 Tax=Suillus placidus TaxID=48579 RepID=A0A9P7D650_9AGAM|nr:hypothetical protein EV702DRAFT_1043350 [Suillus placidus]